MMLYSVCIFKFFVYFLSVQGIPEYKYIPVYNTANRCLYQMQRMQICQQQNQIESSEIEGLADKLSLPEPQRKLTAPSKIP